MDSNNEDLELLKLKAKAKLKLQQQTIKEESVEMDNSDSIDESTVGSELKSIGAGVGTLAAQEAALRSKPAQYVADKIKGGYSGAVEKLVPGGELDKSQIETLMSAGKDKYNTAKPLSEISRDLAGRTQLAGERSTELSKEAENLLVGKKIPIEEYAKDIAETISNDNYSEPLRQLSTDPDDFRSQRARKVATQKGLAVPETFSEQNVLEELDKRDMAESERVKIMSEIEGYEDPKVSKKKLLTDVPKTVEESMGELSAKKGNIKSLLEDLEDRVGSSNLNADQKQKTLSFIKEKKEALKNTQKVKAKSLSSRLVKGQEEAAYNKKVSSKVDSMFKTAEDFVSNPKNNIPESQRLNLMFELEAAKSNYLDKGIVPGSGLRSSKEIGGFLQTGLEDSDKIAQDIKRILSNPQYEIEGKDDLVKKVIEHSKDIPNASSTKELLSMEARNAKELANRVKNESEVLDSIFKDVKKKLGSLGLDLESSSSIRKEIIPVSDIPDILQDIAPALKGRKITSNIKSEVSELVDLVRNIDELSIGPQRKRISDKIATWDKHGASEDEKFLKALYRKVRDRIDSMSPEAGTKLSESSKQLSKKEHYESLLKLKKQKLLEGGEQLVASDLTEKILSTLATETDDKKLEALTKLLKAEGMSDEAILSSIKHFVETGAKYSPDTANVGKLIQATANVAGKGGLAGTLRNTFVGGAGLGTKIQKNLALLPSSKLGKTLKFAGKAIAPVTAAMTAARAGEAMGESLASGELEPVTKFIKEETGLEYLDQPIKDYERGALDKSIPEEEKTTLEESAFRQDYVDPIVAMSKGTSEANLSEFQKKKLQEYRDKGLDITEEKARNRQIQLPGGRANESLFKNILKAKEKKLNNFKLKNKIQDLSPEQIDTLSQQLLKTDSDAARMYAEQLSAAKNLQGTEKTSQLFNLMQQPAFRALLKKGEPVA